MTMDGDGLRNPMGLLLLCFGSEKKLLGSESFWTIPHTPNPRDQFWSNKPNKLLNKLFTFGSCPRIGDFPLKTPVLSFALKIRIKDAELNKLN